MQTLYIGVLAFHGDVIEHIQAIREASRKTKIPIDLIELRTKTPISTLHGLIIPGGESTTLSKLCEREDMLGGMKKIPFIFGTCAGAIMLSKSILHKTPDQKTLERMNIEVDRNAYGRQTESFQEDLSTILGTIPAIFIRAPKITKVGKKVKILAQKNEEILVCEEKVGNIYSLAACFHPELTTTLFHEYFLKKIEKMN